MTRKKTSLESLKPSENTGNTYALLCLAAVVVFLIRTISWALSELWYDEVLSLQYFVFGADTPLAIFRDYRMANNHFLANALEWLWVQMPGTSSGEYMLRIPALAAGVGTIAIILKYWRRQLGDGLTATMAILMALSPVFAAFAWQMRGYSLAMMLATAAFTLACHRHEKPKIAINIMIFLVSMLLPLTMPSAAMAPLAIAAGVAADTLFSRREGVKKAISAALPSAAGAILGTAYYTTMWSQFNAARVEAGGWTSAWAVFGCVAGSFALHLGIFSAAPFITLYKRFRTGNAKPFSPAVSSAVWHLAGALLALCAVLLLPASNGRSPFPRVFLVLLPQVTLACAVLAREHFVFLKTMALPRVLLLAAAPAVAVTALCEWGNGRLLDSPQPPPQNLLMQYYRGAGDARELAYSFSAAAEEPFSSLPARRVIIADPYMATTLLFYWQSAGLSLTLSGDIPAVIPGNMLNPELAPLFNGAYAPELLFLARNPDDIQGMVKQLQLKDIKIVPDRIYSGEHWHLYRGAIQK